MTARAVSPPSAVLRAALSFGLLLGFYGLLLSVAAVLLVLPIGFMKLMGRVNLFTVASFLFTWTPALLLIKSTWSTRRPKFVPPPRRLVTADAPALFAMVNELAALARTKPPAEIYLDSLPNLSVLEAGPAFRTRRVMVVGAPVLGFLSVEELRAGIAHELGHFIGGDTRFVTFNVQAHSLFVSVLEAVERDPFRVGTRHYAIEAGLSFARILGSTLVEGYARLFLWLTRSIDRRQELAADALSATLVGASTTARALERFALCGPLYLDYLNDDVREAIRLGAMPTDLVAGFARRCEQALSGEDGRAYTDAVRTRVTDSYDTHPALGERLRALGPLPNAGVEQRGAPASTLFGDARALDAWIVRATRERVTAAITAGNQRVGALRELDWAQIRTEAFAPRAREAARALAAKLHLVFPTVTTLGGMYAAVWRRVADGNALELAGRIEPDVHRVPAEALERVALELALAMVGTLLQGAMLEGGALVEDSLGPSRLVLRVGDERIDPVETLQRFVVDAAAARPVLDRWAEHLAGAPR